MRSPKPDTEKLREVANQVLEHLKEEEYWVSTRNIRVQCGLAREDELWFMRHVLRKLAFCGAMQCRKLTKKVEWKSWVKVWDPSNPFKNIKPQSDGLESKSEDIKILLEIIHALSKRLDSMESAIEATKEVEIYVREEKTKRREKVKVSGHVHPKLADVLQNLNAKDRKGYRLPVMMIGPAGSGKTYIAEQVAEHFQLPLSVTSCNLNTAEGQFLGRNLPLEYSEKEIVRRYNRLIKLGMPANAAAVACNSPGAFRFITTEFVKSWEEGGVTLLDEMDAADENTMLILNYAMSNHELLIPNRIRNPRAKRHINHILLSACNTFGNGADRQYVARQQLDEAFLDRWRDGQIVLDYDPSLELHLCPDKDLRERLQHYRRKVSEARMRRIISSRFIMNSYYRKQAGRTDIQIDEALFGGWTADEVAKAKEGWMPRRGSEELEVDATVELEAQEEIQGPTATILEAEVPMCPHHNVRMVRMKSNKGWRCNTPGNKWDDVNKKWTICSKGVWDRNK